MKFTLKNFPSHIEKGDCPTCQDYCQWKEGFEKELREIVNACETQVIQGENVRIHLQARAEAFKEILGDSK